MDDIYISGNPEQPNDDMPYNTEPPKKKSGFGKFIKSLIGIIIVLALIIGIGSAVYVYSLAGKIDSSDTEHVNDYVNESDLLSDNKVTNILLIGIDGLLSDYSYRSDVMMLLSIDKANKKIKLTSFLRDMWVDIPANGYAKLNAACAYGNAPLVMDTIEYNFGIDIDNYMLVDFDMFKTIVDNLGGIDVEITEREAKYMNSVCNGMKGYECVDPGESVHVNGTTALYYCRIRYLDSDFMRTSRQRKVLSSVINKAKKSSITTLIDILKTVLPNIKTDLSQSKITKLVLCSLIYMNYDVEQQQIPANGTYSDKMIKGQAVLSIDLDENKQILKDFIYSSKS